ncbi:MAG: PIN domain-containing protein [Rhabdochlamydiaceae bacterium]
MFLDTNVYSALARGVQPAIDVVRAVPELRMPLPVIAELRYGFLKGSQRDRNEQTLQRFLAQPHVSVAVPSLETTNVYAELQQYCMQRGKALSHNDIWIAALAHESGEPLATFDKDFSVFSALLDEKLILLG